LLDSQIAFEHVKEVLSCLRSKKGKQHQHITRERIPTTPPCGIRSLKFLARSPKKRGNNNTSRRKRKGERVLSNERVDGRKTNIPLLTDQSASICHATGGGSTQQGREKNGKRLSVLAFLEGGE